MTQPPKRILVTGSRDWADADAIEAQLCGYPVGTVVVHGACSRKVCGVEVSADMLAARIAVAYGYAVEPYPSDWSVKPDTPAWAVKRRRDGTLYDVRAGALRNEQMLDTGIDLVLAFQRGGSRGTGHVIDSARRRGIPVEVFTQG